MKKLFCLFLFVLLFHELPAQVCFANVDFHRADSVAASCAGLSLKDLGRLSEKLTQPLPTDVEKFRSIYVWVCNNIANDYNLFLENDSKRKKLSGDELKAWSKKFTAKTFRKLYFEKQTVCTGYAYLVKELASRVGIRCVIVNGYGRTAKSNVKEQSNVNHSWNAVLLNNQWYLCDPTWSSGAIDLEQQQFVKKYNNAYFLADPELFVRNHYPVDTSWILLKKKPTMQEFLNRPLIYYAAYNHGVTRFTPDIFEITTTKADTVSFCFETKFSSIEKAALYITQPGRASISVAHARKTNGFYCIDYAFKTKGRYVVTLLLEGEYVVSYTVDVQSRQAIRPTQNLSQLK
ncbi:hypothetical protein WSM22_18590 [Cytophagales bacterium WSM2-2]|nr:hypothetical protein WSM22_18590 [Cytophagales bacterium WSM2-2]